MLAGYYYFLPTVNSVVSSTSLRTFVNHVLSLCPLFLGSCRRGNAHWIGASPFQIFSPGVLALNEQLTKVGAGNVLFAPKYHIIMLFAFLDFQKHYTTSWRKTNGLFVFGGTAEITPIVPAPALKRCIYCLSWNSAGQEMLGINQWQELYSFMSVP